MKVLTRASADFLIIDDDPAITKFLATYLKQKGHTCHTLTEGFQTAAWLEHNQCDVVVVDLNMPKVDGISLISFIREMSRKLPIIVFTGVGYDEDRMHAALRAGANGYVSKNLPIEQLYCVLSRVLATCQQRARREALTARSSSRARRRGLVAAISFEIAPPIRRGVLLCGRANRCDATASARLRALEQSAQTFCRNVFRAARCDRLLFHDNRSSRRADRTARRTCSLAARRSIRRLARARVENLDLARFGARIDGNSFAVKNDNHANAGPVLVIA